jgi:inner membrane protein
MDLTTQLVLGASVGYAVLGKEAGKKSLLWGAVGGFVPDLDTLGTLFLEPIDYVGIHRGFTHSLLFAFIFAPFMAFLVDRLNPKLGIFAWTKLFFWSIITHPLLDSFTAFGTQLFQPFTSFPVSFRSISIIDPLYTVPFYVLIVVLLLRKNSAAMDRFNRIILIGTSAYLVLTCINKCFVHSHFSSALQEQDIAVEELVSSPTLFNNALWMGIGRADDTLYVAMYSHFDENKTITFKKVPRQTALLSAFDSKRATEKLIYFSRGLYRIEERGSELYFSDLRFGRSDFFEKDSGSYTFDYKLIKDGNRLSGIEREVPRLRGAYFSDLIDRIFGKSIN